ncbi:hypothetical protein LEP1GSC171_0322 [Leptospira santarosai str. HAI1380]|uniref:Uncharacterized protein n=1 Tax=Leptospira santarosai str. ZUN179 TaxID=1049985 RepID=M6V0X7_9LEPT|nr:hypothetical protein LEP1GSC169_1663 [Leptospira santarosai str. HAI1349]EMM88327.1 hypothetical protein LEP1GSC039_3240 [Leptospira santarosai str. 2000027870]EMO12954.1 hypothetical protein LEP1GSC165_1865 [Leptospira santarosai str. CBC523]EMO46919.1 hypothetical protein LEP1GSC187_4168 [Leptospira santarosai str. ZUN179]EMP04324.1 hypothetical protein LEP1GSC171_0322 [Leptospira santarosai str. HAI1380]
MQKTRVPKNGNENKSFSSIVIQSKLAANISNPSKTRESTHINDTKPIRKKYLCSRNNDFTIKNKIIVGRKEIKNKTPKYLKKRKKFRNME